MFCMCDTLKKFWHTILINKKSLYFLEKKANNFQYIFVVSQLADEPFQIKNIKENTRKAGLLYQFLFL